MLFNKELTYFSCLNGLIKPNFCPFLCIIEDVIGFCLWTNYSSPESEVLGFLIVLGNLSIYPWKQDGGIIGHHSKR